MAKTSKKKKAKAQAKKAKANLKEPSSSSKVESKEEEAEKDSPQAGPSQLPNKPSSLAEVVASVIHYGIPLHLVVKLVKQRQMMKKEEASGSKSDNSMPPPPDNLANIIFADSVATLKDAHMFTNLPFLARKYLKSIYDHMFTQIRVDFGLQTEHAFHQGHPLFIMLSLIDDRFMAVFAGKLQKDSSYEDKGKTYLIRMEPITNRNPVRVFLSAMV